MKQYTKPLRITRPRNHQRSNSTICQVTDRAPSATSAGAFVVSAVPEAGDTTAGLTETQVLELKTLETEKMDNFLATSFKEWELWIAQTEYRLAHLHNKYRTSYIPIEWLKPLPITASYE